MQPQDATAIAAARVHLPRLADVVADRIREQILSGELADRERLPPLDALLGRFGVSAPSMREALRVLEAEGLLEVQRGSVGGAVVRRPTASTAAYTMALILRSKGTPKGDVAEAIALLEPICAGLCAERPDREQAVVRQLRTLNAAARDLADGDEVAYNETMLDFHRTLVRRCGNDTLALLNRALGHIWAPEVRGWMTASVVHGHYPTPRGRMVEIEYHEHITDLIEAGDTVGAADTLTAHLDEISRAMVGGVDPDAVVDPLAVRFNR